MRLPTTDRGAIDKLRNHFLGKQIPGVGTWGELDALRGWKDDFLGDSLHEQYEEELNGAGSNIVLGDYHGGWVNITSGAGVGRYARLWLGDSAFNYDTLDADEGWLQIGRVKKYVTTNTIIYVLGAQGPSDHRIFIRYDTATSANWLLMATDAGGTTTIDSGVVADNNWHWHALEVYPTAAGREARHWLDGTHINTINTNMPTAALTPMIMVYSAAAEGKNATWDYWAVIPRNLV